MDELDLLCTNCGFQNPFGMKFCGNCGTRLAAPTASAPAAQSPADLPERLGVMMGADLRERFRQAGLEASGQRRSVTILFVDLTGYTSLSERLESEQLYELLQDYIQMLADTVYRYEGMVDKLTGDGLMALFGAPISNENNAERALRAALDMHQGMQRLNKKWKITPGYDLSIHIGVNDGTVIVGGIGSDLLLNYTAVGDSVNTAKRLEESAHAGTTLVSEQVFRQTSALFEFQSLPPLQLKGKSEAVPALQLIGLRARPELVRGIKGLYGPMVGREAELQRVRSVIQRLAHKKLGGLVLISGEAGIGKSRLTREVKALIEASSIRVLEGQTLTYRKSIPYWIFQDVMHSYLEANANLPRPALRNLLRERVQMVLKQDAERALPYLEYMLSLDPSDPVAAETIRYMDAEQLHQQIFLAMHDLLVAESRLQPLLLIMEDVHWADDSSIELILHLLESVGQLPLAIYAISRPFEGGAIGKIREFGRKMLPNCFTEIELLSLKPEQSQQLLYSLLAIPQIPEELTAEIIQRSAGLPFFMEEILRVLIEKKVILQVNDTWQFNPAADVAGLGVPETLQNLILARFDRLDPEQRLVLQTAAAIGYQFGMPVLKAVVESRLQRGIEAILSYLVEREFILPQPESGEESYLFRHALVSDAIYGTLLQRRRKDLHGQIGNAIEKLYSDRLDDQVELLANHYHNSLLPDKALHYLILAGQKAARRFANEQARQHFEQALGLLGRVRYRDDQYLMVHEGLGDVLVLIGEYQAARSHYQNALERISEMEEKGSRVEPGWCEQTALLYRKIATTFERQGDYDKVLARLYLAQQAIDRLACVPPVEQANILNDLGWIYFRRGNLDLAEKYLLQALPLVEETPYYTVTASVYNRLGGIMYQKDRLDLTTEYVLKSLKLREKIGDMAAVARSYNNLGLISWRAGKWKDGLDYLERSFELQTRLGDIVAIIDLHANLGLLQLDRGDTAQAEKHLQEALVISQQIGHGRHAAQACLNLTFYFVQIEDWKSALKYSRLSQEKYKEIGVMDELVELYAYTGKACLGKGDLNTAEQWARDALELFDQLGKGKSQRRIEDQAQALRLMGDICREREEFEHARQYYEQCIETFRSIDDQVEYARSLVALARLGKKADGGQPEDLLDEARSIFNHLGARLDIHKLAAIAAQDK